MKTIHHFAVLTCLGSLGIGFARAQFNSGSTGAYGPLHVTNVGGITTLNLPPDGIFHCTTINIAAGAFLRFNCNTNNTPVYLLAQGDVTISGAIDVSAKDVEGQFPPVGSKGGPGGFDGGFPGSGATPPGNGYGPGGGRGGSLSTDPSAAGSGSYSTVYGGFPSSTNNGSVYGSPLLVPLVGGSGGGGTAGNPGFGGGGGGGAILIASSTRIVCDQFSYIDANGGHGHETARNHGSGGAIRLVAPVISGTLSLTAIGWNRLAGAGRIRLDSIDRRNMSVGAEPTASIGSYMTVFPLNNPRLDITDAAGTAIPEGSNPVFIQLPNGSSTNRTVTVQARNFNAQVPIEIAITPENGERTRYQTNINNLTSNPASVTINVGIPVSTVVTISAWTR